MPLQLKIDNQVFRFVNKGVVVLKYAHVASGFRISGYFDRTNRRHLSLFKPLDFKEVILETTRGERLITATTLNTKFKTSAVQQLTNISGYSKTGVLGDCQIPVDSYPLEFNNVSLLEIAGQLLQPFGLNVSAENDDGAASEVIDTVTAENSQTISQFLTEIAAQRDLIITHDEAGNLLITKANASQPSIATYREELPVLDISLRVNGQAMHSDITVMQQTDIDTDNAAEFTVQNPLVGAFRPTVQLQNVGNDNNTEAAAKRVRATELRNIVLTIRVDRWEWLNNGTPEVMRPNNIISVISPENYIFQRTDFFVETVKLFQDAKKEVAELTCVLPQVYNGQDPVNIFG